MKLLVFSESAGFRKQVEDMVSSTSNQAEARGLGEMMAKTKAGGFDGVLTDHQSWQRCAAMFRYFECLDGLNQKPMIMFSKNRKAPSLKLRRAKTFTTHVSVPIQGEEFQSALQQISNAA